jgi:hypothetical protein
MPSAAIDQLRHVLWLVSESIPLIPAGNRKQIVINPGGA